jgi:hypothetical protein
MRFILVGLGTLVLFASVTSQAAGNGSASPAVVADNFVDALKHHRFKDAAAMFAPDAVQDTGGTERTLMRVDESLGGFSTIRPVATLPDGKSVKLEVPMPKNISFKVQRFVQIRYASTASDGQPVFYELNLTSDNMPSKVLSFGLHFPVKDAQSTKRANQLVSAINR